MGRWSSGYDATLTRWRSSVQNKGRCRTCIPLSTLKESLTRPTIKWARGATEARYLGMVEVPSGFFLREKPNRKFKAGVKLSASPPFFGLIGGKI